VNEFARMAAARRATRQKSWASPSANARYARARPRRQQQGVAAVIHREGTVKNHVTHVFAKLEVDDRTRPPSRRKSWASA